MSNSGQIRLFDDHDQYQMNYFYQKFFNKKIIFMKEKFKHLKNLFICFKIKNNSLILYNIKLISSCRSTLFILYLSIQILKIVFLNCV